MALILCLASTTGTTYKVTSCCIWSAVMAVLKSGGSNGRQGPLEQSPSGQLGLVLHDLGWCPFQ